MGKAYVCDRCGKLFRKDDLSLHVDVILENKIGFPLAFGRTDNNEVLQICPKCRASFQKWWDEGAVYKTTEPNLVNIHPLYEVDEDE